MARLFSFPWPRCRAVLGAACLALSAAACGPARAEGGLQRIWDHTHLVDIRLGTERSADARSLRRGGYELSDSTYVGFSKWYSTDWTDLHIDFMTQISDGFGMLWGIGTGEAGRKYRIAPSLKVGVILRHEVSRNSALSLQLTTVIGGRLNEEACVADYGDIGGVQRVNCRLAASYIEPSETLNYLLNEAPYDQTQLEISYVIRF